MISNKKSHWLRKLLVTASAGLLVGSMAYFVPDADAGRGGRRGGGSVRHSSKGGNRSSAGHRSNRGGSRHSAGNRSNRGGNRSSAGNRGGNRGGNRAGSGRGNRGGGNTINNRGGNTNVNINANRGGATRANRGGSRARRGSYSARGRHGRAHHHYSAREDARRDYFRFRTVNHLIRAGVQLASQPKYSTTVVVTGTTYYYAGGVYYAQQGTQYVVVAPPPGAVVYAVPTTTTVVYVGDQPYYYYGATLMESTSYSIDGRCSHSTLFSTGSIFVALDFTNRAPANLHSGTRSMWMSSAA